MVYSKDVEKIFEKYKNNIYRLALSILRNEKDAEDVLQNTLIKIMRNLGAFRKESKISTWIYKIAYNEALMYLRKRYRQTRLSDYLKRPQVKSSSGLFVNWAKLPDQELLDEEFKERMENAINNMPIKYRMPALLHHVERLPLKESAHVLGLKVNSLKTRLHRAHLIIRTGLQDYYKDKEEPEHTGDKKCGIWIDFIRRYAQEFPDKKMRASFKKYIRDCSACKSFFQQYAQAIRITRVLQCQDVPLELQERIGAFITKNKDKLAKEANNA
ncbi:MAG: sigma-70 family RNA polymerase sigma factor [Candidatus Omnitrophica bacterium]|nr:sigma-70 family RNA polymerase sigma factor [Candidatus Omnitrophota bacterium]